MDALTIAQTVTDELGLPRITNLADTTDVTTRQILSLMNRSGDEIYQSSEWTHAQKLHVVNIGTPVTTTGDVTAGSDIITNIPSTAGIEANYYAVTGNFLVTSTRVVEVLSATSVRIDQPATGTQAAADLVFAKDTYALPDDFSWYLNRTMWDRTNRWELIGPISPQTDEYNRSGVVTTGPRRRWRQVGLPATCWRLWPPPTATGSFPATLIFEYVSKFWVLNDAGNFQGSFTANTDVPTIDAQAIILSTKWRFFAVKGFDYAAMQAEAIDYINRLASRDGGKPDISLAKPMQSSILITPANVPDGFWTGPGNTN